MDWPFRNLTTIFLHRPNPQMKVLNDWLAYYRKRYAVMGSVATGDGSKPANESEEAREGGRSGDTGDQSEDAVESVSSQAMG
jgi:hypothetical protein